MVASASRMPHPGRAPMSHATETVHGAMRCPNLAITRHNERRTREIDRSAARSCAKNHALATSAIVAFGQNSRGRAACRRRLPRHVAFARILDAAARADAACRGYAAVALGPRPRPGLDRAAPAALVHQRRSCERDIGAAESHAAVSVLVTSAFNRPGELPARSNPIGGNHVLQFPHRPPVSAGCRQ